MAKISELEKRIETLENQSFAHKLLVDELENKIQQLEERLANSTSPYLTWTLPVTQINSQDSGVEWLSTQFVTVSDNSV